MFVGPHYGQSCISALACSGDLTFAALTRPLHLSICDRGKEIKKTALSYTNASVIMMECLGDVLLLLHSDNTLSQVDAGSHGTKRH